jgi:hypothetical protein
MVSGNLLQVLVWLCTAVSETPEEHISINHRQGPGVPRGIRSMAIVSTMRFAGLVALPVKFVYHRERAREAFSVPESSLKTDLTLSIRFSLAPLTMRIIEQHKIIRELRDYLPKMSRTDQYDFEMFAKRDKDDEELDALSIMKLEAMQRKYVVRKSKKDIEELFKKMTNQPPDKQDN